VQCPRFAAPLVAAAVAVYFAMPAPANPVPADDLSLLNGAELFERHCTACHGWDPAEQYQSLYGEDPIEGPDPLLSITEPEEEIDPTEFVPEEPDDWPEWAGPPPEVEDPERDIKMSVLTDLTGAIDEVYADENETYGWDTYADEEPGGDDELSAAERFGDDPTGEQTRSPGATDLTDPQSFIYGTTETDLYFNIINGTGASMPGFRDEIGSEEAVWDLVNYIRSLWDEDWID